jgi:hypothetical protein
LGNLQNPPHQCLLCPLVIASFPPDPALFVVPDPPSIYHWYPFEWQEYVTLPANTYEWFELSEITYSDPPQPYGKAENFVSLKFQETPSSLAVSVDNDQQAHGYTWVFVEDPYSDPPVVTEKEGTPVVAVLEQLSFLFKDLDFALGDSEGTVTYFYGLGTRYSVGYVGGFYEGEFL